jgi:hypothetical protein
VYVIFGGNHYSNPFNVDALNSSTGIYISSSYTYFGDAVGALGDWNGDGIGDISVGNQGGAAWVIFGSRTPSASISVDSYLNGTTGFNITSSAGFGWTVSSVGDINGDGLQDLGIGAAGGAGVAYVLFGNGSAYPL